MEIQAFKSTTTTICSEFRLACHTKADTTTTQSPRFTRKFLNCHWVVKRHNDTLPVAFPARIKSWSDDYRPNKTSENKIRAVAVTDRQQQQEAIKCDQKKCILVFTKNTKWLSSSWSWYGLGYERLLLPIELDWACCCCFRTFPLQPTVSTPRDTAS